MVNADRGSSEAACLIANGQAYRREMREAESRVVDLVGHAGGVVQLGALRVAEIITSVVERDPTVLKAKPRRLAFPDIPISYSRPMEQFALPNAEKITEAVRESVKKGH